MGCNQSSSVDDGGDGSAKARNAEIEAQLRADRAREKNTIKVCPLGFVSFTQTDVGVQMLLLGAGEASLTVHVHEFVC